MYPDSVSEPSTQTSVFIFCGLSKNALTSELVVFTKKGRLSIKSPDTKFGYNDLVKLSAIIGNTIDRPENEADCNAGEGAALTALPSSNSILAELFNENDATNNNNPAIFQIEFLTISPMLTGGLAHPHFPGLLTHSKGHKSKYQATLSNFQGSACYLVCWTKMTF
jgi:hypothetical protein